MTWMVSEKVDDLDDSRFVTAVVASETSSEQIPEGFHLAFRTRIFPKALMPEVFFAFSQKVFSKRLEKNTLRFRIDKEPLGAGEFTPGELSSAAFLSEPATMYLPFIKAETLLVEIPTMTSGTVRGSFPIKNFEDVLAKILGTHIDFPVETLKQFHPRIVDDLLRRGDGNFEFLIEAINASKFFKRLDPYRGTKTLEVFAAVQKFAEDNRASELFGTFEGNSSRPNMPWHYAMYKNAPQSLRTKYGSLKLFQ